MKKELQSKDFRIGNFIRFNNKPQRIIFADIEYMEYNQFHKNAIGEILPIEITKRWLEDLGGILNHEDDSYIFKHFAVSVNEKSEALMFFKDEEIAEFNYIHELQNLYFALTGEELELKNVTP